MTVEMIRRAICRALELPNAEDSCPVPPRRPARFRSQPEEA
jgi:hypothetical protein